ncbi:YlxR family protein [Brachybacterium sp. EF45031]|uniref:YlxR family protein n=1 Tax=Brachybacterium sillae TaxID=2810536 RepID=UPI00217E1851|nr:YlxR family protein [Brachybacterium sillae]MCS6712348.1 YlxR family protein [Brachybacterium sillae]
MSDRSTAAGPQRTCIGCRQVTEREQLVRLVRVDSPDGGTPQLRHDPTGSAPGRGAWLHPDATCLDRALRRGAAARSFRSAVDTGHLARDLESVITSPTRKRGDEAMDIR